MGRRKAFLDSLHLVRGKPWLSSLVPRQVYTLFPSLSGQHKEICKHNNSQQQSLISKSYSKLERKSKAITKSRNGEYCWGIVGNVGESRGITGNVGESWGIVRNMRGIAGNHGECRGISGNSGEYARNHGECRGIMGYIARNGGESRGIARNRGEY